VNVLNHRVKKYFKIKIDDFEVFSAREFFGYATARDKSLWDFAHAFNVSLNIICMRKKEKGRLKIIYERDNMAFIPKTAKRTGKFIEDVELVTSELVPNCHRCMVMVGHHKRTGEPGWYASCKKTGKMESVGPQESFHKALKILTLTKGCDSCEFNESKEKDTFLLTLEEEIEKEAIELFGEEHILSRVKGAVLNFVQYRNYFDIHFKDKFGVRFFKSVPDDSIAVVDLINPCSNQREFALKIQALAGLLDRTNTNEIRDKIKDPEKRELSGSINILEQILKENSRSYSKHMISNLRNLFSLRSKMYPAHSTATEILTIIQNFGIAYYPPDNWEDTFQKILGLCISNLENLVKELQSWRAQMEEHG